MLTIRACSPATSSRWRKPRDERLRLGQHLVRRQRAPGDLVAGREPAVRAHRDALVGQVERREEVDGAPEPRDGGVVGGGPGPRAASGAAGDSRAAKSGDALRAARARSTSAGGLRRQAAQPGEVGAEEVGGGRAGGHARGPALEVHRRGHDERKPVRGEDASASERAAASPARKPCRPASTALAEGGAHGGPGRRRCRWRC